MSKFILALLFLVGTAACSQPHTSQLQLVTGKTNDLGGLFSDAQKSQLDSVSMIFSFKTNIPISVVTYGTANTTQAEADAFVQHADSLLFLDHSDVTVMNVFLSKDFRALNLQVHSPAGADTSKIEQWKTKMKQMFTNSVQPYVPLLKDGKYSDALIATISDLGVAIKKDM